MTSAATRIEGDQHQRSEAVSEDGDPDQDLDQDVNADATASATASPAAEAGRAATGGGQRRRRDDQRQRHHGHCEQDRAPAGHAFTAAATGPIPGWSWTMC